MLIGAAQIDTGAAPHRAHGVTICAWEGDVRSASAETPALNARLQGRNETAFAEEDRRGLMPASKTRTIALDVWTSERQARGDASLRVGIGLYSGPVIAGDIGSERRLEHGVIGDTETSVGNWMLDAASAVDA